MAVVVNAQALGSLTVKDINEGKLPDGDGFILLPREKVIRVEEELEDHGSAMVPSAVLEHFIRTASCRVITNFCICREGHECKTYPRDMGCIFLGDAAKDISEELGRQVGVEECLAYAAEARKLGLHQIVGRFHADAHWLNVAPVQKLVTICNCCTCCCGMRMNKYLNPQESKRVLSPMPGLEIAVTDDCSGCGVCEEQCAFDGIHMDDGQAVIDPEKCKICGSCADACPSDAIQITFKKGGYVQETIESISKRADVTSG
jgi:ferredoxin